MSETAIDFAFLTAEEELELEVVDPDGTTVVCEISRDPSESLGIVPARDTIRECANECVFCFIDGNPPGARDPLWLRDDDFRLSFTYGSYVTLTNLGPRGLQRLVDQRLSPLYVSVHATNPELRVRLLKNDRAGLILDQLKIPPRRGACRYTPRRSSVRTGTTGTSWIARFGNSTPWVKGSCRFPWSPWASPATT